jgi:hypothetical protein
MKSRDPDFTIKAFVDRIAERRPHDLGNLKRILRVVVPALAARKDMAFDRDDGGEYEAFVSLAPASWLLDLIECQDGPWAPWLVEAEPEIQLVAAYRKDYRKALNRCIKHAVMSHLMSTAVKGVSVEWLADRAVLAEYLPINQEKLAALVAAGVTERLDKNLLTDPKGAIRAAGNVLNAFNAMGRYFTGLGIVRRQDVTRADLYLPKGSPGAGRSYYRHMEALGATTRASHAHVGWDILAELQPHVPAVAWPDPLGDRQYGLTPKERPPLFVAMMADIRKAVEGCITADTLGILNNMIIRYGGFLKRKLSLDLDEICAGLDSPRKLALLFFGTFPLSEDGDEPLFEVELAKLRDSVEYRQEVIADIGRKIRKHKSNDAPPRANPLVVAFLDWLMDTKREGAAAAVANPLVMVATKYLKADDSQVEWLGEKRKAVRQRNEKKAAKGRKETKNRLSRNPGLYADFVRNFDRLDKNVTRLRTAMDANPDSAPHAGRWALALRDATIFKLLFHSPVRARTIHFAKLDEQVLADEGQLHLTPDVTKNKSEILRNLREFGAFGNLREDVATYVKEARGIILAGRESPYFLATRPCRKEVYDVSGNLMAGYQAVARIVRGVSRKHFPDLLEKARIAELTPHCPRDLLTNFMHTEGGSVDISAAALGDTEETVLRHYRGRTKLNDDKLTDFLDERIGSCQTAESLFKSLEAIMRTSDTPAAKVKRARKLLKGS